MAYFEKAPAQLFHLTHVFLDSLERETGKVEVVWSSPKFFRRCWASSRRSRRARRSSRRTFRGWTFELPEEESWLTEREKSNLSRWLCFSFDRIPKNQTISKSSSLQSALQSLQVWTRVCLCCLTIDSFSCFEVFWPLLAWPGLLLYTLRASDTVTAVASATLPLLARPPSIRNFATFPWSFKNTSCC